MATHLQLSQLDVDIQRRQPQFGIFKFDYGRNGQLEVDQI
jgi:hypothetical protein